MSRRIDLIEEISKIDPTSKIMFTTYKYNQLFFENYLFRKFNAAMPLIIIDYFEYQSNILDYGKSKYAERKYFLEPVKCKKVFHPKFFLSVGKNNIRIWIGSNNLTPQGFASNLELIMPIEINLKTKENLELIPDLKALLSSLNGLMKSESHNERLTNIYEAIPNYEGNSVKSSWILHNINEPLIPQITRIIQYPIKKLHVISPFYSNSKDFYLSMHKICGSIHIVVQQKNNNLPKNILEDLPGFNYSIMETSKDRILHAKLLLFETDVINYIFAGSANFTSSALYSCDNVEIGILSDLNMNISLKEIIDDIGQLKNVNLHEIISDSTENFTNDDSKVDFNILESKLMGNTLKITLSEPIIEGKIALFVGGEIKEFPINKKGNILEFEIPEEDLIKFNRSVIVKIEIENQERIYCSDWRLVYNPSIFPERYEILNSLDTNDANFLFSVLDKLSKITNFSEYILILDILDKKDFFIEDGKEEIAIDLRNKIMSMPQYNHTEKLKDVIDRFIVRHQNRIDKAIKRYVLSWDDIPGNDSKRLIEFLTQNFGIEWEKNAKIEKIDDGKTINVFDGRNFLSLKLSDGEPGVILEINDHRTNKFIAEVKNDKLNIIINSINISSANLAISSFILTNKLIIFSISKKYYEIHLLSNIRINLDKFIVINDGYVNNLVKRGYSKIIIENSLKYHIALLTFVIDSLQRQSSEYLPDARLGFNCVKHVFERTTIKALKILIDLDGNMFKEDKLHGFMKEYAQIYPDLAEKSPRVIISLLNDLIGSANSHSNAKCNTIKIDEV